MKMREKTSGELSGWRMGKGNKNFSIRGHLFPIWKGATEGGGADEEDCAGLGWKYSNFFFCGGG